MPDLNICSDICQIRTNNAKFKIQTLYLFEAEVALRQIFLQMFANDGV